MNARATDENTRQGHFLSLNGFSDPSVATDSSRNINGVDLYSQIAGFLAYKHLNGRSPQVLANLADLMGDCPDLVFAFEVRDTQYSPRIGAERLVEAITPLDEDGAQSQQDDATEEI